MLHHPVVPAPASEFFAGVVHWAAQAAPYAGTAGLLIGGACAWAVRHRTRRARAALARRTVVEVIPTATFDPGEGEVRRFGRHLARVRYAADGIPVRGAAVRIRYSADGGQMRCFLEGPAQAAAILAMPGFAEVEVRATHSGTGIQPVRFTVPAPREAGK
ncbi:hypothetical protein AB0K43_30005 [Kitasatospora sp. NPDC049258]|uniref:hypothetical protein n=1 Tax=Kitasatospora sp. NPDC049258 TaxID=3155394 RepID=UPI00343544B3